MENLSGRRAGTVVVIRSAHADLPDAVRACLDRQFSDGLYFVPIRHHSPACALALQTLIREVKPAAVLIEGPDTMTALTPLLLDQGTRPPVAVLCQTESVTSADAESENSAKRLHSAFFPFCDYSPEWVALKEGASANAQLAFIDLPWREKMAKDEANSDARSMMEERYLAHSAYLHALADRSGCRDQDELWDHLFELRAQASITDWRAFLSDVFCYCAMARLDYEPEVLEADGSLPRERHMAQHIRQWRAKIKGAIVVVTGGFHTMALLDLLQAPADSDKPVRSKKKSDKQAGNQGMWLIRYSFDRLDSLNGYSAGMPSPAYYQWVWEQMQAAPHSNYLQNIAIDSLTGIAQQSRARGLSDRLSTSDVQAASLQAARLAALRGNYGPGRQDLLDAVRSCFVKGAIDDGTQGLLGDLRRYLGGTRMGDIPPSAGSPPLIENARQLARSHGVRLDDSEARTARLDLYRKQGHRERSRFFHLMSYLDTGLASWQGGPDFLGGSGLDLMFEEWRHAWTPLVEARLIELALDGATLADVALEKLRREEAALDAQSQARSANHAVGLLLRACLIGLHDRLPALFALLSVHLNEDQNFGSIVACGHRLLTLWRAREPLGMQQHPDLLALMRQIEPSALYLLPALADVDAARESEVIEQLLALRSFQRSIGSTSEKQIESNIPLFHTQLLRILASPHAAPGICGAAAALLFLDGCWTESRLAELLSNRFGIGADTHDTVRFVGGLMAAAPKLLIAQDTLCAEFNRIVANWDEEQFVAYLPDLRRTFTALKPQETSDLAGKLAELNGSGDDDFSILAQTHYLATEEDLLEGSRLQLSLQECLRRDALELWISPTDGARNEQ